MNVVYPVSVTNWRKLLKFLYQGLVYFNILPVWLLQDPFRFLVAILRVWESQYVVFRLSSHQFQ